MLNKKKAKNKSQHYCKRLLAILFMCLIALSGIVFLYIRFSSNAPLLPRPSLKELAARDGVELGMLTQPERLTDPTYAHILASQYSFMTSDSEIHWDKLRPSQSTYNFAALNTFMAFAQKNALSVQMHHLLWGEKDSLPAWLKNGNYSRQQLLEIIHDHIRTLVGHYKGQVTEWSVVNERFTRMKHIYGLADWWADHLGGGTDYIDDAFIWAHQADPNAKLILNDFYNESETSVSDAEYAYLKSAKERGVPIDGIGMQMHVDASRPPDKAAMIKNMKRFGALGIPVYITEFDIDSSAVKADEAHEAALEARITADVVSACVESKSCISFDVFGMTDTDNLLALVTQAKIRSHLLSSSYEPKSSFYSFRQGWIAP